MYAKNIKPSAKCEIQTEQTAKRDDQIARPRRAQTCRFSSIGGSKMNLFFWQGSIKCTLWPASRKKYVFLNFNKKFTNQKSRRIKFWNARAPDCRETAKYSLNLNQSNFHWLNEWFAFSLIQRKKNFHYWIS